MAFSYKKKIFLNHCRSYLSNKTLRTSKFQSTVEWILTLKSWSVCWGNVIHKNYHLMAHELQSLLCIRFLQEIAFSISSFASAHSKWYLSQHHHIASGFSKVRQCYPMITNLSYLSILAKKNADLEGNLIPNIIWIV